MSKAEAAAVWMPINDLTPWADNPRDNAAAIPEVAKSIKRFGFASPIIARPIEGGGFEIIAGHTRHQAALSLGLDRVPVRVMDLDPTDAKLLALADNKVGEIATWSDGLGDILRELEADGIDLDGLGFGDDELGELLAPLPIEPDGTEDDVLEVEEGEPDSKPGEVYELGPHRLACGDSTHPALWDAVLDDDGSAAVFTSPPYGLTSCALSGNKAHAERGSAYLEDESPWLPMMDGWTRCALDRCETVCANVQMLAGNKRELLTWMGDWSDHLVDVAAWDKGHGPPQMAANVLSNVFEFVVILGEAGSSRAIPSASFQGTEANVYRGTPQRKNEHAAIHGATFPVDFATWGVSVLCATASVVVDPFGGTGTTLIACAMTGRRARLIELDPRYCDVIRRRWTAWAKKHGQDPGPGALE